MTSRTAAGTIHTLFQVSTAWIFYKIMHLTGFLTITVNAIPQLNRDQHYLFVSNHQSYLDVYAMFMGLKPRLIYQACPLRYMTGQSVYYSPMMPFVWLGGGFPTKRRAPHYHAVEYAISRLDRGERVVIFPEGRRSIPGKIAPHSGVQRIIRGAARPFSIILVHLEWNRTSWWRRTLQVAYEEYSGSDDPHDIMRRIYSL